MKLSSYLSQILILLALISNNSLASESINPLDEDDSSYSSSEDEYEEEMNLKVSEAHSFMLYQKLVKEIKQLKIIKADLIDFYKLAAANSDLSNIVGLDEIQQRIIEKLNAISVDCKINKNYELILARKRMKENLDSVTMWVENN